MFLTKFKRIGFYAFSLVIMTTATTEAGWFSKPKPKPRIEKDPAAVILNQKESADLEEKNRQALNELSKVMSVRLSEIQNKTVAGETEVALSLAKQTLDEVRVKVGIDPKANLRRKFLVPLTFPENATSMRSLSESQQEIVIRTVQNFRGGLFLDILNLSKRTSLLYIQALHEQIIKSGGLTTEDRNKIVKDLAQASIISLPIQDRNGVQIIVFDEEVANEDHIYMFNREIKMYLLNAQDLKISEVDFDKYRQDFKKPSTPAAMLSQGDFKQALTCMSHASTVPNEYDRNTARYSCFRLYIFYSNFFNECKTVADNIANEYDRNRAIYSCFYRFKEGRAYK